MSNQKFGRVFPGHFQSTFEYNRRSRRKIHRHEDPTIILSSPRRTWRPGNCIVFLRRFRHLLRQCVCFHMTCIQGTPDGRKSLTDFGKEPPFICDCA